MKRVFLLALVISVLFAAQALAVPYTNSGMYLETFSGNENKDTVVEAALQSLGFEIDVTFYGKVDGSSGTSPNGKLIISSLADAKSGEWNTVDPINFYTVKASTFWALYKVDPATDMGTWSTKDITNNGGNQPTVSHVSAWTTASSSVAEPATLALFGLGLLGLTGINRKRLFRRP